MRAWMCCRTRRRFALPLAAVCVAMCCCCCAGGGGAGSARTGAPSYVYMHSRMGAYAYVECAGGGGGGGGGLLAAADSAASAVSVAGQTVRTGGVTVAVEAVEAVCEYAFAYGGICICRMRRGQRDCPSG